MAEKRLFPTTHGTLESIAGNKPGTLVQKLESADLNTDMNKFTIFAQFKSDAKGIDTGDKVIQNSEETKKLITSAVDGTQGKFFKQLKERNSKISNEVEKLKSKLDDSDIETLKGLCTIGKKI